VDDTFLVLMNAHDEAVPFVLLDILPTERWETTVDTGSPARVGLAFRGRNQYELRGRAAACLALRRR
jgi:hypothetical protein